MGEFINLSDSEEILLLNSPNTSVFENSTEQLVLEAQKVSILENTEEEDSLLLDNNENVFIDPIVEIIDKPDEECGDCVSSSYGEWDQFGYFKKENYLSELASEYERAMARKNLGIADSYAMLWGNISGNIVNQADLINWVESYYRDNTNKLISDINTVLNTWQQNINLELSYKANINSPSFSGIPTAPLPSLENNTAQIATTEWVNAKLNGLGVINNSLATLNINPQSALLGDGPVDITVTWEYNAAISEQYINNNILPLDSRYYLLTNVSADQVISLKFKVNNVFYEVSKNFIIYTPFLYGKNLVTLYKTKDNEFSVEALSNEYIYVLVPGHSDAIISVNGWAGGFKLEGSKLYNDVLYYIYKSVNHSLGRCKIKVEW